MSKNLAVFISGNGSNFQALLDHEIQNGEIKLLVSNRSNAYGLKRAENSKIPTYVLKNRNYDDLKDTLDSLNIDGIILAGYLDIVPKEFVDAYPMKIINIHPSLIPSFCGQGYYGKKVHQAALDYGVKFSGATSHFVTEIADEGPIILQEIVPIEDHDTADTLASKVLKEEHALLCKTVDLFCLNQLKINGRRVILGGNND